MQTGTLLPFLEDHEDICSWRPDNRQRNPTFTFENQIAKLKVHQRCQSATIIKFKDQEFWHWREKLVFSPFGGKFLFLSGCYPAIPGPWHWPRHWPSFHQHNRVSARQGPYIKLIISSCTLVFVRNTTSESVLTNENIFPVYFAQTHSEIEIRMSLTIQEYTHLECISHWIYRFN